MINKWQLMMTVFICVLLCSLASCGKTVSDEDVNDLYIETKYALPENINRVTDMMVDEEGVWYVAAETVDEGIQVLSSEDKGKTWEVEQEMLRHESIEPLKPQEWSGFFLTGKEIMIVVDEYKDNSYNEVTQHIFHMTETGINRELSLKMPESALVFSVYPIDASNVVVDTIDGNTYIVDIENEIVISEVFSDGEFSHIYTDDGTVYGLIGMEYDHIAMYDIKSDEYTKVGKAFEGCSDDSGQGTFGVNKTPDSESFCYANRDGVWLHDSQGTYKIVNGANSILGDEKSFFAYNPMLFEGENILLPVSSDNGEAIYQYSPQKEERKITELTAYTLVESSVVDNILNAYQRANPDVHITLKEGIDNYDQPATDAIKNLNTKLLGGDGPDIIFMDGMNTSKYIDEGVLEGMPENIENQIEESNFGIPNQYSINGDVFAVPLGFTYMVAAGDDVLLDNLNDFTKWSNLLETGSDYFNHVTVDNVPVICYTAYFEPKIQGKKKINKREVKEFYQNLECVFKSYDLEWNERFASYDNLNMQINPLSSFSYVADGESKAAIDYISSIKDLQAVRQVDSMPMSDENGQILYIPRGVVAVNKNSEHKDKINEVIAYLISDEGQSEICRNDLLPNNKRALEKALVQQKESIEITGEATKILNGFSQEEAEKIVSMTDNMQRAVRTDDIIMNIIMSNAESYLNGDKEINEAVSDAVKQVNLYLSE